MEQVAVAAACHKRRGARTGEGDPSVVVDLPFDPHMNYRPVQSLGHL